MGTWFAQHFQLRTQILIISGGSVKYPFFAAQLDFTDQIVGGNMFECLIPDPLMELRNKQE